MSDTYEDERWCNHCGKYTNHNCRDSNHERDSSEDYEECKDCGYWMTGFNLKQSPPWED